MKIIVFSDSHRDTSRMFSVMEKVGECVDMIFHLGDCLEDAAQLTVRFPRVKVLCVRGNCDSYVSGSESEIVVPIKERKILLSHGHKYDVKYGLQRIVYTAEEKQIDACLFGHTHQPALFECGTSLFMNPGSISQPRGSMNPSYGILDISEYGVIKGQIVERRGNVYKPIAYI